MKEWRHIINEHVNSGIQMTNSIMKEWTHLIWFAKLWIMLQSVLNNFSYELAGYSQWLHFWTCNLARFGFEWSNPFMPIRSYLSCLDTIKSSFQKIFEIEMQVTSQLQLTVKYLINSHALFQCHFQQYWIYKQYL